MNVCYSSQVYAWAIFLSMQIMLVAVEHVRLFLFKIYVLYFVYAIKRAGAIASP